MGGSGDAADEPCPDCSFVLCVPVCGGGGGRPGVRGQISLALVPRPRGVGGGRWAEPADRVECDERAQRALAHPDSRPRALEPGDLGRPDFRDHRGQRRSRPRLPLRHRRAHGPALRPGTEYLVRVRDRSLRRRRALGTRGGQRHSRDPAPPQKQLRLGDAGDRREARRGAGGHRKPVPLRLRRNAALGGGPRCPGLGRLLRRHLPVGGRQLADHLGEPGDRAGRPAGRLLHRRLRHRHR